MTNDHHAMVNALLAAVLHPHRAGPRGAVAPGAPTQPHADGAELAAVAVARRYPGRAPFLARQPGRSERVAATAEGSERRVSRRWLAKHGFRSARQPHRADAANDRRRPAPAAPGPHAADQPVSLRPR